MESKLKTCHRLLGSLEELAQQEAACRNSGDVVALAALFERAAPLVAFLAEHGPALADSGLRARLAAWLVRRKETSVWLSGQVAEAREKLASVDAARGRASLVRPVYGGGLDARRPRLAAIG